MNLKKNKFELKSLIIVSLIIAFLFFAVTNVTASILPAEVIKELEAGECYTVETTVEIPGESQKVDVVFSLDLTKKMEDILNTMKSENEGIMNTLITTYPSVSFTFGVMSHTDYPKKFTSCDYTDWYGVTDFDYAYSLDAPLTNITTAVTTAIESLSIKDGWDKPEDYTRIFYESYADSNIGWRDDAEKLLVNFADSYPHDCNLNESIYSGTWSTGGDPGPDEIINTSDDLDLQTELAAMNTNGITLIECHSSTSYLDYWEYWTGITGGSVNYTNSSNFVDVVEDAIISKLTFSKIYDLQLVVTPAKFGSWLTVDPPIPAEVETGTSVTFNETICVPIETLPGTYEFNISAVDGDGNNYGNQTNVITINNPPVANDDYANTNEDVSVIIDVLANDTDDDGTIDPTTVVVTVGPSDGIATVNLTGEIEYTPDSDFYGSDSFNYTVDDDDGATSNEATVSITVNAVNNPPDAPITPDPSDGATGTETSVTLSVYVTDPDSDPLDVNFYDASDDSLIDIDAGVASGNTASVPWNGLSYSTTYSWYAVADDSEYTTKSTTWSFTTGASGGGGGGGGGDDLPPNIPPIADASAGEPYIGFVEEDITFDGSDSYDPDTGGYIISWHWDFDDGTDGYGEKITHNYSSVGTYHVTLTVTDGNSGTDTETFDVVISIANNAPEDLEVDGPLTGDQNTDYDYTASATDPDEKDMLRFIFEWGDGTTTTSEVVASGVIVTVTHNWSAYGIFEVTVTALDNYSADISTTFNVLIDVIIIEGDITGLIIDEDGSDPYDIFNNTDTDGETEVELDNGSYLIDSDGDGEWDYAYDPDTGLITYYDFVYEKYFVIYEANKAPGFELLTMLAVIGLIAIILRKKRKNN